MLKPRSPQASFYGDYLYERIVPQDHLLRKINQIVDFSFVHDLLKDCYTPNFGRPAEDSEFMLRLCLLQYIYGDSDREVVANARMHMAYKYFLGIAVDAEVPDDTTICHFRARRLGEEKFRQVFEQIVQQCLDKGLVKGKRQIIDSTHIVADMAVNSLTGLLNLCRRNVLREVHRQNPKKARKLGIDGLGDPQIVKFKDKEQGLDTEIEAATRLLDGVTNELKRGKLEVTDSLKQNLELLEKAVADRQDGSKDRLVSPVDTDARMGRKDSKRWAGYKGHLVIEEESEIITSVSTTPANKDDGSQLKPLLYRQEQCISVVPDEFSADKAYDSGANLEYLDAKGITGNIALSKRANHMGKGLFTVEDFTYDPDTGTLTCPAGCITARRRRDVVNRPDQKRKGEIFQFTSEQCAECRLKDRCHPGNSETHGRSVHVSFYDSYFRNMKARMQSEEGRAAYNRRSLIEHKVADLARYCGMRRSRYRGLSRTGIHTLLAATVSNLKRMAKLLWQPPDISPPVPLAAR